MKIQIVTILIVIIAIIGLSGMTAAKSGKEDRKCKDEQKGIVGSIILTGGKTKTNTPHGDCKDKEKEKKHNKKHHKKHD